MCHAGRCGTSCHQSHSGHPAVRRRCHWLVYGSREECRRSDIAGSRSPLHAGRAVGVVAGSDVKFPFHSCQVDEVALDQCLLVMRVGFLVPPSEGGLSCSARAMFLEPCAEKSKVAEVILEYNNNLTHETVHYERMFQASLSKLPPAEGEVTEDNDSNNNDDNNDTDTGERGAVDTGAGIGGDTASDEVGHAFRLLLHHRCASRTVRVGAGIGRIRRRNSLALRV